MSALEFQQAENTAHPWAGLPGRKTNDHKISGAVSLAAALALVATPAFAQAQRVLTISSWGGSLQKAQKDAWFALIEKELNVTIKEDNTSGIADVRTQVASGKPTWDLTTQGAYTCKLLEKRGGWRILTPTR